MEQDDTTADDEAQYAELELSDSTVIYDRGNHQAWLQSDGAVEARAMV
ncbi:MULTISPECIES: DUF7331 family protein [Salinibaculum]